MAAPTPPSGSTPSDASAVSSRLAEPPMSTSSRSSAGFGGLSGRLVTPATLADLWGDLVWPKLLTSVRLALRPSRIGLAAIYLLGIGLLLALADHIDSSPKTNILAQFLDPRFGQLLSRLWTDIVGFRGDLAGTTIHLLFIGIPLDIIEKAPWMMVVMVPLMTFWTALFGGAISRMAACDHAHGLRITWPEALGFAVSRWNSLWMALAVPLLLVWGIALAMAVAGLAFRVPVLNVLGGAGWGLFLLGGLVVAVIATVYAVGHAMLVPAVAAEGADAIDAVQHAYAFVFARPLRLVIYLGVLIVQAALVLTIAALITEFAVGVARGSASLWATDNIADKVIVTDNAARDLSSLSSTDRAARWCVNLWTALPTLLFAAFAVSLYWCSSTMLYLSMRRVCDGQDTAEIWMPGLVPGTLASAKSSGVRMAESTVVSSKPSEGVSDTGPADET